jgi:hypothetical protein
MHGAEYYMRPEGYSCPMKPSRYLMASRGKMIKLWFTKRTKTCLHDLATICICNWQSARLEARYLVEVLGVGQYAGRADALNILI